MKTVKELREKLGLSQSQFANIFGIPVTTVQSWEQGKRRPASYVFNMMCKMVLSLSSCEMFSQNTVYGVLVGAFGETDVVMQPITADGMLFDFYVKSRDLYIDVKNTFIHEHDWYDESRDIAKVMKYRMLAQDKDTYKVLLDVWTRRDVMKRKYAADKNLNYITFWDDDLSDMYDWFECDCPDGSDYNGKYSWFDANVLSDVIDGAAYIYCEPNAEIIKLNDYTITPCIMNHVVDIAALQRVHLYWFDDDVDVNFDFDDSLFRVAYYNEEEHFFILQGLNHIVYRLEKKEM